MPDTPNAAFGFSISACSSGTESGDTNVEKGTTKHRNPANLNANKGTGDRGTTSEEERDEKANTSDQKSYYKGDVRENK